MNIHFIESENILLVYFPDTLRFFSINPITKDLITYIAENKDINFALKQFNLSKKQYVDFKNKLENYATMTKIQQSNNNENVLNRLVLNISNTCNLKCRYCYADGGSYNSDESIMTREMAKLTLDKFYFFFNKINNIQIFGGEPLVNMPVVNFICKYVRNRDAVNKEKTIIGLVTNGTLMNSEFMKMVNKYDIQVTVSYDGNPKVNDIMRVYANGSGTSDIILNNIKMLKKNTNQPTTIEVTFNRNHIDNNIKIIDIIKFIYTTLGKIPLHIVPAGGKKDCFYALKNRNEFINSVDDIFLNSKNGITYTYSLVQRIISSLVYKKDTGKYICQAGIGTLSVSVNGYIYPCFMFTDNENVCMGNIKDKNIFHSETFFKIIKKFDSFNKNENEKCKRCFISKICSGCFGMNYLENGKIFTLSDQYCEMSQKMTEKVILSLFKLSEYLKSGEDNEYAKC